MQFSDKSEISSTAVDCLFHPPPPLQVLDHNIEFGQTRGLLSLILKLLAYSAAPDMERYTKFEQEERHASSGGPEYGLGALPSHLQAPWLRVFFVILYKVSTHACIIIYTSLYLWKFHSLLFTKPGSLLLPPPLYSKPVAPPPPPPTHP